jgi:hypothetical protein
VTERTGYWIGPDRWAEPTVDEPDPTGGRHAFDRDANLTPIFTTLRRRARRSHPRPVVHDPRPAPVDHLRLDPPTVLLPVVPPHPAGFEHAPVRPVAVPAPSPTETTTWWRSPVGFPAVPEREPLHLVDDRARHDLVSDDRAAWAPSPRAVSHDSGPYAAVPYAHGSYEVASYDAVPYDAVAYEHGPYEQGPYDQGPYAQAAYEQAPYDRRFDRAAPDPAAYGRGRFDGRSADPGWYDPVTDTGRHHRRLAPAGW